MTPATVSGWAVWLVNCSESGLHAFARDNRVVPHREETADQFRQRLVFMAVDGEFDGYEAPP